MTAAVPQYAKEAGPMTWELDETPYVYVVPLNRKRTILLQEDSFECKFFVYNLRDSEEDYVEATVNYHKVDTIDDEVDNSSQLTSPRIEARGHVLAIANYQDDWDGYGAIRPLSECLSHALDILGDEQFNVEHLTDIYPNPNGTITFEWEQNDNEIGLELGNNEFSYYAHIGNHHSYNNKKQYAADEITRLAEYVSFLG